MNTPKSPILPPNEYMTVTVLGASGDLAKKKTYPALFALYKNDFLPANAQIIGYARSALELDDFRKRLRDHIKCANEQEAKETLPSFLNNCHYVVGQYDKGEDFDKLNAVIANYEQALGETGNKCHRVFYMALPPDVFIPVADNVRKHCYSSKGWTRVVVEKPFGKDTESSRELATALGKNWTENELYRIDHYLGKEMVKNIIAMRFANLFFATVWNRTAIDNVQITFKEKIGTEGRGGYFNTFGIIRDVMQNHLFQMLTVMAMERPVSLMADDIRNEKVRVLRSIPPLKLEDVILGQYTASEDGLQVSYLDDKTVPKDSLTATFAAAVFRINNERWDGVPFILKCGKALNEGKAEIRIQFRDAPGGIFPVPLSRNELVIRVQPNEAVYLKVMNKQPGLSFNPIISELDLSYNMRYEGLRIPEAYESLILDVLRGEQANFVRNDELDAAWKIFTPVLHQIEREKVKPELYPFGSRGPESLNAFLERHGVARDRQEYNWSPSNAKPNTKSSKM